MIDKWVKYVDENIEEIIEVISLRLINRFCEENNIIVSESDKMDMLVDYYKIISDKFRIEE